MTHYPRKVANETKGQATRRAIITAMLARKKGAEVTGGDLERDTGIPAKSITQNMPRLVDMGLVERTGGKEGVLFYALAPVKVEVEA